VPVPVLTTCAAGLDATLHRPRLARKRL